MSACESRGSRIHPVTCLHGSCVSTTMSDGVPGDMLGHVILALSSDFLPGTRIWGMTTIYFNTRGIYK